MAAPVAISNFTVGPYNHISPTSWDHTAELGKTVYVVATYLGYAGEGVLTATYNGVPMVKQHVSQDANSQFHTAEIFSLTTPTIGTHQVEVSGNGIFRVASFNIANGPTDGCVTGVSTAMSGVTARHLYGFGYDTDDLIIGWFEVYQPQLEGPHTVTDGTQLYSTARFAVGYKQADGGETKISFATTAGDTAGGEQFGLIFTIPSVNQVVNGGAYQPWMGRATSLVSNIASSNALPHVALTNTTTISPQTPHLAVPCTIRNLQIDLKVAPGSGNVRNFRVYKNGVPTALAFSISGTNTSNNITGIDVPCYRWSRVEIRETSTGASTANSEYTYCLECETGEDGISVYGPGGHYYSFSPVNGSTGRTNPFSSVGASSGTWRNARVDEGRVGCNGSLIGLFFSYRLEIGQSKYDSYVWKSTNDGQSYVRQDGTGGTVNTYRQLTRPFGNTQQGFTYWYVPFDLPLNVGDQVYVELTGTDNTGGGLNSAMMVTAVFRATTNGEWFVNGETDNANQLFYDPHQNRIGGGFGSPESQAEYVVGPTTVPVVITGVNWGVQVPPGVGQTRTFVLRHNATTTISAPITGTNHSGQGGGNEIFAANDRFDVEPGEAFTTQAGWVTAWWTLRGFMQPPQDGILIVRKVVSTGTGSTFTIGVGGGLSPSSLSLADGESHTYDPVPPGSGYSVSETPPATWDTPVISVSNLSDPNNISVAAGETVTVTVTNSRNEAVEGCVDTLAVTPVAGRDGCTASIPTL